MTKMLYSKHCIRSRYTCYLWTSDGKKSCSLFNCVLLHRFELFSHVIVVLFDGSKSCINFIVDGHFLRDVLFLVLQLESLQLITLALVSRNLLLQCNRIPKGFYLAFNGFDFAKANSQGSFSLLMFLLHVLFAFGLSIFYDLKPIHDFCQGFFTGLQLIQIILKLSTNNCCFFSGLHFEVHEERADIGAKANTKQL